MTEHITQLPSPTRFHAIATTCLSGLVGLLIALPLFLSGKPGGQFSIALLPLMGLAVGYRRRNSRFFFYLALVVVLMLSSMLSGAIFRLSS